jgi:hypothetical protein
MISSGVRLAIVFTVAACNYSPQSATPGVEGDGPPDDGPVDTGDAPPDSFVGPPPSACVTRWLTGDLDFATPAFLPQPTGIGGSLVSADDDRDPFLSSNELVIYYTRPGTGGDLDVVFAERAAIGLAFGGTGTKTSLTDPAQSEGKVAMTADDLTGIVSSRRAGGEGAFDLWQATRTGAGGLDAFPPLDQNFLADVNDNGDQQDPYLSGDGLRLYYATGVPQRLVVSRRTALLANFGAPTDIPNIGDASGDADPALSGDERVIVFTSNRAGGAGGADLWYATRTERDQPFSTPVNLPQVNGTASDGDPHLSEDGCRLYFASSRGVGDFDVFFTQLQ